MIDELGLRSDTLNKAHPADRKGVLLMEPDHVRLAELALLLIDTHYRVTSVCDVRDLYYLRDAEDLELFLLSDTLGEFELRAAAHVIRQRWPLARILVMGMAATVLDDHLYDDSIRQRCQPMDLLYAVVRLSDGAWQQRARREGSPLGQTQAGGPQARVTLAESNPAKAKVSLISGEPGVQRMLRTG